MSRFVRPSKYRHVYGEKPKQHYENAKISGSAWDTDLVTAGGKYLAVNWQVSGGGAFAILPLASAFTQPSPAGFPYKLPDILPLARGHTSPVLDTAWSTFDDNLVASAGEDGKIFLWRISDGMFEGWGEDGWKPEDLSPTGRLNAGGRKVGQVAFHPTSANVLTSASGDHLIRVWDIEHESDAKLTFKGHTDSVQSFAWNYVGTTLATTCRDKKIRLFDPRSGSDPVRVVDGHSGVKGSRLVWAGDRDRIITTGFSRMSDRQMGLWDTGSLENLQMESVDASAGVLMPFFAEGNDVLFLAGKGDGNIRYFEFENDSLHFLNEYKSSEPQRGMTLLPRRALEVGSNEIARVFKLAGHGIEPLSFIVPRKAESFQSDIFPPATSAESAQSASDFFDGKTARPKIIDLETKAVSSSSGNIPSAPKAVPYAGNASGAATPVRGVSTPAPTPAKDRVTSPQPTKSASTPIPAAPAAVPAKEEDKEKEAASPEQDAKSLEIPKPESDDETPIHTPPKEQSKTIGESVKDTAVAAATALGVGGLVGAGAAEAADTKKDEPKKEESKSANGAASVTAPSSHLLIKKLSDKATTPTRGSSLSAGYDLYAADQATVPARGKALVDTQLSIAVPEGTYGRVAPRSGLASKHSIDTGAGVIDADNRGPVMVLLYNFSDNDFTINHGDRIAQLILEKIVMAPILEVDDLEATARGEGGFGSTGGFGKN